MGKLGATFVTPGLAMALGQPTCNNIYCKNQRNKGLGFKTLINPSK